MLIWWVALAEWDGTGCGDYELSRMEHHGPSDGDVTYGVRLDQLPNSTVSALIGESAILKAVSIAGSFQCTATFTP